MRFAGDSDLSGVQFGMEVTGLRELERNLNKLGKCVTKTMLNKATAAGAKVIKAEAKRQASSIKDTGVLRRSITVKRLKGRRDRAVSLVGCRNKNYLVKVKPKTARGHDATTGQFTSVKVRVKDRVVREVIRNPARYSHIVELGTSHSRAQPFLRPAIKRKRKAAEREIVRVLRSEIQKAIRKIKVKR